ncbi:hypothetical protein OSH11_13750 [Kaistia dalseonensis]|uniref:DUF3457 domain-containing protein n=1 Tax=Kaistia dalseonensis TaxID=410840 RepID=A0ABU0H938_9HYPH|nr:hypothetical protein [Kaistia dalseonensis]MCX5495773.1 hypothetical protein [Kaistia dalseonensis]MDQ0438373.1 hypothetical protein [Kaistia dalseonensis]
MVEFRAQETGPSERGAAIPDAVNLAPTLEGPCGRAWLVDLAGVRRRLDQARPDTTVAAWIVEASWAHPVWHSYLVGLVHLRPDPLVLQPILHRPDATHEFWLFALDPDKPRAPQISGEQRAAMLFPSNFGAQLACPSDAEAMKTIEAAINEIVRGTLSPDTDFRRDWVARFGASNIEVR